MVLNAYVTFLLLIHTSIVEIQIGGNTMKEEWKDIQGFEGYYQVSNMGRVKSLNYKRTGKEKIMKGVDDGRGYLILTLYREGKGKTCKIHKLVAQAFLENPKGYNEVNHKDENKYNNCADNLEFCSRQYNIEYSQAKAVIGINKVSGLILDFPSAMEAERQTGISHGNICKCCNGKRKSAGGHVWFFVD